MRSRLLKKIGLLMKNNSPYAELFRTYLVGAMNLVIGLTLSYIMQFYFLRFISFPLRTYVSNTLAFLIGVFFAYILTRKIVFNFDSILGTLKEFISFISISLINLFAPLGVWFLINLVNTEIQKNEIKYLIVTILIHGTILPLKYLVYKFFVFKPSLKK